MLQRAAVTPYQAYNHVFTLCQENGTDDLPVMKDKNTSSSVHYIAEQEILQNIYFKLKSLLFRKRYRKGSLCHYMA